MSFQCRFCNNKGCIACPGEREKYIREEERLRSERIRNWQPLTAKKRNELVDFAIMFSSLSNSGEITREQAEKLVSDKYDIPEPMATIKLDGDLDSANELLGGDALQAIMARVNEDLDVFPDELAKNAEEYRVKQRLARTKET